MQIITSIAEMRLACRLLHRGASHGDAMLGLVPTMGAIHAGHLSLVAVARAECAIVAASIFVNPLQFAPTEDFGKYPRTFKQDCEQLDAGGVDLLFAPDAAEMYPPGATTFVEVGGLSDRLDGAFRPGHFRGVATVVTKLFNIVMPDVAYFGRKDAAQVAVVKAMVRDLNLPIRVSVCATVREDDGLAMSSRNRYLTPEQRLTARSISRALLSAQRIAMRGEKSARILSETMHRELSGIGGLRMEYVEIVHPVTLERLDTVHAGALLAVAAWVGGTRLIDNLELASTYERPDDLG